MGSRRDRLDVELAALATLSPAQLREQWVKITGRVLPRVSPALLRLALAMNCRLARSAAYRASPGSD